jgi:hypothetical protein
MAIRRSSWVSEANKAVDRRPNGAFEAQQPASVALFARVPKKKSGSGRGDKVTVAVFSVGELLDVLVSARERFPVRVKRHHFRGGPKPMVSQTGNAPGSQLGTTPGRVYRDAARARSWGEHEPQKLCVWLTERNLLGCWRYTWSKGVVMIGKPEALKVGGIAHHGSRCFQHGRPEGAHGRATGCNLRSPN